MDGKQIAPKEPPKSDSVFSMVLMSPVDAELTVAEKVINLMSRSLVLQNSRNASTTSPSTSLTTNLCPLIAEIPLTLSLETMHVLL